MDTGSVVPSKADLAIKGIQQLGALGILGLFIWLFFKFLNQGGMTCPSL